MSITREVCRKLFEGGWRGQGKKLIYGESCPATL